MFTTTAALRRVPTRSLLNSFHYNKFNAASNYSYSSLSTRINISLTNANTDVVESPNSSRCTTNPRKLFSTAPATNGTKTPPKTKPRRRLQLDAIKVTKNAADRLKDLLKGEGTEGAIGIRLGVKRRGCNGLSYTMNYTKEKPEKDEEVVAYGVHVFIEPMALLSVVGTTMDYEDTELASEFTFKNPNSKGECGCGESFNV